MISDNRTLKFQLTADMLLGLLSEVGVGGSFIQLDDLYGNWGNSFLSGGEQCFYQISTSFWVKKNSDEHSIVDSTVYIGNHDLFCYLGDIINNFLPE